MSLGSSTPIPVVLSDIFVWILVFALSAVVVIVLHLYLSIRKKSVEYSYMAGLGLFLLLELVLEKGIQWMPTLIFIVSLYPPTIKTLASSIRDTSRKGDTGSTALGTNMKIFADDCEDDVNEEENSSSSGDVVLIERAGTVKGVSALRVDPATSTVQPLSCITFLTALSKFDRQQERSNYALDWLFRVDVDPQIGGGAEYQFMVITSGKLKKGRQSESEEHVVDLVRETTVYLRSALRSAGLVEEGEVTTVPGIELAKKTVSYIDQSNDSTDTEAEDDRSSMFDLVAVAGLPKKLVVVEDYAACTNGVPSPRDSASLLSTLLHPVSRLARLMISEKVAGSYVVRFRKAKPPEGVAVVDNDMVDAMMGSRSPRVDGLIRAGNSAGRGRLPIQFLMRQNVAGRLRIEDREEFAGEVIAGVRRGYWSVGAYVAIERRNRQKSRSNAARTDSSFPPSEGAVKVASALVSCFSGAGRSIDTEILGRDIANRFTGDPVLSPIHSGAESKLGVDVPPVSTGEMSSDTLASFINLSPPYPMPEGDASLLAEFEIPSNGESRGNGLLHLGKAYFRGTLIGEVKIPISDFATHEVVLGETGLGKTTLVADQLVQLWNLNPTINWVVIDLKGEYYHHLQPNIDEKILVLEAGGSVNCIPLHLDLFNNDSQSLHGEGDDSADSDRIGRVFSALRESLVGLFKENTELSPMMERILFESLKAIMTTAANPGDGDAKSTGEGFFDALFDAVGKYVTNHKGRDFKMSSEALKNRLERFRRGVIGDILNSRDGGKDGAPVEPDFREMLRTGKVIVDLSGCVRRGCSKEDMRLLLNVITSVIFEEAFERGVVGAPALRHLTVIEEANLLVPDVLRRRTMGDLTATEDMILTARGFGEGLILVAQRPTVSSFVLANAGTKVVFRSPYDASRVGEFMGLNEEQERVVKSLRKFEALVTTVQGGPYKVSTAKPQQPATLSHPTEQKLEPTNRTTPPSPSGSLPSSRSEATEVIEANDDYVEGGRGHYTQDGRGDGTSPALAHDRASVDNDVEAFDSASQQDVQKLLKLRETSSDVFMLFKMAASSSPLLVKVPDAILEVFGGKLRKFLATKRRLTNAAAWRKPLVTFDNSTVKLTEYGKEVWNAFQQRRNHADTPPDKKNRGGPTRKPSSQSKIANGKG